MQTAHAGSWGGREVISKLCAGCEAHLSQWVSLYCTRWSMSDLVYSLN